MIKQKQNTSYKAMLRDRLPLLINLALKWCKAKECWINHVYDNFINVFTEKDQRYEATRIVLGISSKYRNFDFKKTIAWENLTKEEADSWEAVRSWVTWFQNYAPQIKDRYDEYKHIYNDHTRLVQYIVDNFIDTENKDTAYKLVEFIISNYG
jgi:hypothetical protein